MFLLLNKKELISIYWQIVTCLSPIPYTSPLTSATSAFLTPLFTPLTQDEMGWTHLRIHIQHCSETEKEFLNVVNAGGWWWEGEREIFFCLIFIVLRIFLNKNEMVPISGNPHKSSENSF